MGRHILVDPYHPGGNFLERLLLCSHRNLGQLIPGVIQELGKGAGLKPRPAGILASHTLETRVVGIITAIIAMPTAPTHLALLWSWLWAVLENIILAFPEP